MSDLPSFSVVIPTYNRAQFIGATLESVFAQTYQNFEVIVVDNCSTDKTSDVLEPYIRSDRIKFFQNDSNRERAFSRNVGLKAATGDYVTLLDSDDLMYSGNLSDAAAFARANPDIKCFHNRYELLDQSRKVIYRYRLPSLRNRLLAISNGNFMACIGNFIHRDIFRAYSFDTSRDLIGSEDWEFWLRVLGDNEIGRIDKVNSGIVQHPGRSINSQDIKSMERGIKYMVAKIRGSEHLSNIYAKYLDRIESNGLLYLNLLSNDARDQGRAWNYLRRAANADRSVVFTSRFVRSMRRTLVGNLRG